MTTLDVGLVLHFYAMLVFYGGMSTDTALGVPGTLVIFLFLAHAAVRYRPELIVYGTVLFVAGWAVIHAAAEGEFQLHWPGRSETTELAFLVLLALTALALFLTASRARTLEHHGTVDKFIGDGVMAVFGIPTPSPSDALHAVRGVRAVLNGIALWNAERRCDGLPVISVGAGAHFGDVVVGAIGDTGRLEYTLIGDAVNVAQRLERVCAETRDAFIASLDLLEAARRAGRIGNWTELSVRSIRGRMRPVRLFAPAAS